MAAAVTTAEEAAATTTIDRFRGPPKNHQERVDILRRSYLINGPCTRGEIGRRARLRCVWGNPWEFESPRVHTFSFEGGFVPRSSRPSLSLGKGYFRSGCDHQLFQRRPSYFSTSFFSTSAMVPPGGTHFSTSGKSSLQFSHFFPG